MRKKCKMKEKNKHREDKDMKQRITKIEDENQISLELINKNIF